MIESLLVANRGEIARRVFRTAKRLGIRAVAVYSEADAHSLHVQDADEAVCIGESRAQESYLKIEAILRAASETKVQAIHPGYGFLAENADFARAVEADGLIFIGPSPDVIAAMGDKEKARSLARSLSIPLSPGCGVLASLEDAQQTASEIGYPVLLKAVAGGGGIGMKKVDREEALEKSLKEVKNRAKAAFGDDRVYLEKYLESPHHIEIQVIGDGQGKVITFPERECSIQRRHQKVIEESPSPFANDTLRASLREAAENFAQELNYLNAGTVEFIVDAERNFYFLEMNTRLQVEHPVTEEITGLDLVELQLKVASKEQLGSIEPDRLRQGSSIEARIYAEDPVRFFPSPGKITAYNIPTGKGIRLENGFQSGDTITPFYDPMIAKLIASGEDREEARHRLVQALAEYEISGIKTNIPFLKKALSHDLFIKGEYDTHFIEKMGNV